MDQVKQMATALLAVSNTAQYEIRYFLTSCKCAQDESMQAYGVKIRLFNGGELIAESSVNDISCSRNEVVALISLLSRNSVTPVALYDVVEDYLAG